MPVLSFLDAAEEVLRRHSPGAPLHYRRITELALGDGLIETAGQTPEASMASRLSVDIRQRELSGKPQRFVSHGRGLYGLATPVGPLGGTIDRHNADVRRRLRDALAGMDPQAFEHVIGDLLSAVGFEEVEVTRYSGDGGIDVRAKLTVGGITDVRTAVQVKRWSSRVAGKTIRELRGGLGPHERGLVITLSDFTRDAQAEAAATDRTPITLVNGSRLIDLLVENEIGVTSTTYSLLALEEETLGLVEYESPEAAEAEATHAPERTRYTGTKALSMWPLPGGRDAWKRTLDDILDYIASSAPSVDEAVDWMIQRYERVASRRVVKSYFASVLRPLGLIETKNERLVLTSAGAEYVADPANGALLALARAKVAGFDEILSALATTPRTADELLSILRDQLGVTWETDAQVRFRLGWLEILGAVHEDGAKWHITESSLEVSHPTVATPAPGRLRTPTP